MSVVVVFRARVCWCCVISRVVCSSPLPGGGVFGKAKSWKVGSGDRASSVEITESKRLKPFGQISAMEN